MCNNEVMCHLWYINVGRLCVSLCLRACVFHLITLDGGFVGQFGCYIILCSR